MPTGRVFLAGTKYASGTYGSDVVTVDPAKPNLSLQITVYDSTTDASLLTTDRIHIFFDFTDPKNIQVIEVFIISNPTKQAVVKNTIMASDSLLPPDHPKVFDSKSVPFC